MVVEYHGCDASTLDDATGIQALMERAAEQSAATIVQTVIHSDLSDRRHRRLRPRVPGTGTPEPGGIRWVEFEEIIDALGCSETCVVGFDVMELAPSLDPSGASSIVAAKIVRELLLATRLPQPQAG
jgi:arginase family enzyme